MAAGASFDVSRTASPYHIVSGQTISGGGTGAGAGTVAASIAGPLVVDSGAQLTVGTATATGLLATNDLTLASGSTLNINIAGPTAGTDFDQLLVTGAVSLSGASLVGNQTSFIDSPIGQTYTIISNDSTDTVVGTFAGLPEGSPFNIGDLGFTISYVGGTDNNDVVLTLQVPEPGSAAAIGVAAIGLLARRRRRSA